MDSINFTGAFLIKNPTKAAKEQIEILAHKRRQIFENFDNTSDVLYIVRPSREENIAKFILDNNLHFKFFPNITTNSGLDPLFPNEAVQKTKNAKYVIFSKKFLARKFNLLPESEKYETNVSGIVNALNLNQNELSISTKNGVTYAFAKDGKNLFKSSPTNRYGENYVYFNDIKNNELKKLLVKDDKIICVYPKNAEYFDINFKNSLILHIDETV